MSNIDKTALQRDGTFTVPDDGLKIPAESWEQPNLPVDQEDWDLNLRERLDDTNASSTVVQDVLVSTQAMVNTYSSLALETLVALGAFPTGSVPTSNISLSLPDVPSIDGLDPTKPTRPTYDAPSVGEQPTLRGDIITPTMNPVDRPVVAYPAEPTEELEWLESVYLSDLLDNLKAALQDILNNGGTGLGETYENAVWSRAVSRLDLAYETKYDEAENYYASKRHVAPPGALIDRIDLLQRERGKEEALISSDIAAKQLEIANTHRQFCLDLSYKTEQMTITQKNETENRALDAIKSTITLLYDKYKTALGGIQTKADIYKTDVAAETARIDSISAANKSLTDTLNAETTAWKSRLDAEFGIVEQVIRMYVAELGGYSAEVDAGAKRMGALVDRYKAQIGAAEVEGQISLGEYEQLVKAILGEIQLRLGAQQESGRISSQVSAAALSAFNASASISDGTSRSKSYSEGRSMSMGLSLSRSISNSLGMSYSFSEDAGDRFSQSHSYSLSTGA